MRKRQKKAMILSYTSDAFDFGFCMFEFSLLLLSCKIGSGQGLKIYTRKHFSTLIDCGHVDNTKWCRDVKFEY